MRALLDTHAFLWWVGDHPRLSARARGYIADRRHEILFSTASAWEIAIKYQLGKLRIPGDLHAFLTTHLTHNSVQLLPVHLTHAVQVQGLPSHHRDPFDRMLIAQAQVENLPILTDDEQFRHYPVEVIW